MNINRNLLDFGSSVRDGRGLVHWMQNRGDHRAFSAPSERQVHILETWKSKRVWFFCGNPSLEYGIWQQPENIKTLWPTDVTCIYCLMHVLSIDTCLADRIEVDKDAAKP
jgi:hypothetical protein